MSHRGSTQTLGDLSTQKAHRSDDASKAASRIREDWQQSGDCDLPSAVAKSPCILKDRSIFLDLVQDEFRHLVKVSESLSSSEYCRRFSNLDSDLLGSVNRLVEVEQYLNDNPGLLQLSDEPAWPSIGDQFANFLLCEEVGRGAASRVFLARQTDIGDREVIVKITPFIDSEASTLGKLDHPHIVSVHATGIEPATGLGWICMPFLGRYTLERFINDKAQHSHSTELEIVSIAQRIASGLSYIHDKGFLHGDLKPSNVLLTKQGVPMLIDFNLARGKESTGDLSLVGGTLPYMSPEQLSRICRTKDSVPVTHASEMFSFGVLLFQAIFGYLPFETTCGSKEIRSVAGNLLESQQKQQVELSNQLRGMDPAVRRLLASCLALHPNDRPRDFYVVEETLSRIASRRHQWLQYARRRPVWTFVLVSCALLCITTAYSQFLSLKKTSALANARIHTSKNNLDASMQLLSSVLRRDPSDIGANRLMAANLLAKAEIDRAAEQYMTTWRLAHDPLDIAMVGYCKNLSGDHASAIRLYDEASKRGLVLASVQNNLAVSYARRLQDHFNYEESEEAKQLMQSAMDLSPECVSVRINMLNHYFVTQGLPKGKRPNYPLDVTVLPFNASVNQTFCELALRFIAEQSQGEEDYARYGQPVIQRLVSIIGIESLSEGLTRDQLKPYQTFVRSMDTQRIELAYFPVSIPVFLSPMEDSQH